jgi:hypothetical protein
MSVLCARCPRGSLIQTKWPTSPFEDATAWAAFSTSTSMPRDLRGRSSRQGQGQPVARPCCVMSTISLVSDDYAGANAAMR